MLVERTFHVRPGTRVVETFEANFIPHNGLSRRRPRLDITTTDIDRFADLLADGFNVTEASALIGKPFNYGAAILQRIRARLGPQAK